MDVWIVARFVEGDERILVGIRPHLSLPDGWLFAAYLRSETGFDEWQLSDLFDYESQAELIADIANEFDRNNGFTWLSESARQIAEARLCG